MNMSTYWEPDEQPRIMSVLVELNQDGSVVQAADWPDLKEDIQTKLTGYGVSAEDADALVQPLTDAVAGGEDFRVLVDQLSSEYSDSDTEAEETVEQAPEQASEQASDPAFDQALPPVDELARAVIDAIGTELAGLITAEATGTVSEQQLGEWVAEDVAAAIDEVAKLDWAF